jgi:ParB family chromosome partitioning protein
MSLGRGLGALITSTGKNNQQQNFAGDESKIWHIPVSKISPDPKQPRKNFNVQELQQLSDSIKEHGILQPILVVEKQDGGYEIVAGERRWRAAQTAGVATVPAIIKKFADQKRLEISLIENIQRSDLSPIEEAFAYKRLIDEFGLTQQELAVKVGKSRPALANSMRLLGLSEPAKQALVEGKINAGQARALLSIEDEKGQLDMLSSMLGNKITVRELEGEVNRQKIAANKPIRRDPNIIYLEGKLRNELGTKVRITQKGGRGAISLDFYSKEEFDRLLKKLLNQ